jgi:hypothetical protein
LKSIYRMKNIQKYFECIELVHSRNEKTCKWNEFFENDVVLIDLLCKL